MTRVQKVALDHCLSGYPSDRSYETILDLIAENSDDVLVWYPFERVTGEALVEIIESLVDSIEEAFGASAKGR